MTVLLVVTEHPALLDDERARHHERARERLARVSGQPVETLPYPDCRRLDAYGAVVLSGSRAPWAAHEADALARLGDVVRAYDGPVLGICAGMQLQAMFAGGAVETRHAQAVAEYRPVEVLDDHDLLRGLPERPSFYEHHTDEVTTLPDGFRVLARSERCGVEAIAASDRPWWGTQFHPEEFSGEHPHGERVLRNFFELAT